MLGGMALRTAIYGAGSLGTVLGAYIARAGGQAQLVSRNAAHIAALRAHGAQVVGQAAFTVPVEACLPEEMRGKYDCIILMTKQQENEAVANFLLPHLKEDGVCCTAQNGLPEAGLMRVLGKHRVVGCTVGWGATLLSPGVAELTSAPDAMRMTVGSTVPGNTMARAARISAALALMHVLTPASSRLFWTLRRLPLL